MKAFRASSPDARQAAGARSTSSDVDEPATAAARRRAAPAARPGSRATVRCARAPSRCRPRACSLSLALIGWAVVMRYVLNRPPVWTDDAVGFLLVAIVMLAAAQVLRRGEHIGVDVLHRAPARPRRALGASLGRAGRRRGRGRSWSSTAGRRRCSRASSASSPRAASSCPVWWLMLLLPVGGALMALAWWWSRCGGSCSACRRWSRTARLATTTNDDRSDPGRPGRGCCSRASRSSRGCRSSAACCCWVRAGLHR